MRRGGAIAGNEKEGGLWGIGMVKGRHRQESFVI